MKKFSLAAGVLSVLMLSGCGLKVGTGDTYDWHGAYFKELYLNRGSLSENDYASYLQEIADDADPKKPRVLPPGFYANLGLAWYRAGDAKQAVTYLKKEAEIWPEGKKAVLSLVADIEKENAEVSDDSSKSSKDASLTDNSEKAKHEKADIETSQTEQADNEKSLTDTEKTENNNPVQNKTVPNETVQNERALNQTVFEGSNKAIESKEAKATEPQDSEDRNATMEGGKSNEK